MFLSWKHDVKKFQLVKFLCLVSGLFCMKVILCMISFGYDYHWTLKGFPSLTALRADTCLKFLENRTIVFELES